MYEVGKVATTHGIKGELKINSLSDFERFTKNEKFYVIKNNVKVHLTVEKARNHKNSLIVKFLEFNNINEVLDFRNLIVYSDKKGELKTNEFYHESLINLKVYTIDNVYIGLVNDILELPHGHLLEILTDEKKVLIPFVKEFIGSIDNEKIIIKPIEGLL